MDQNGALERLKKNTAEILTSEELEQRLSSGEPLTHYIGFEISGYVHLGTGLMSALVMKDLTELGVKCTVWLADWHTIINEKLDGTLVTAQRIGQGYFAEALKASFAAVGGDPNQLEIRLASEWYDQNWSRYWETVIRVAQHTTTSRMLRSIDILGRQAGTEVDHAKTIYPAMQVADIFFQDVAIAHAGIDQRKAHVIMRDVASKVIPDQPKPIALHHELLLGLQAPANPELVIGSEKLTGEQRVKAITEAKMSKSKAGSAVFVHDSEEDIEKKIQKAFCPEKEIQHNPLLNWTKHVLFWNRKKSFRIEREAKHGGDTEFNTYPELEAAYAAGEVHPMDLKAAVATELVTLLAPVREHFAKPEITALKEELDKVLENR